VRRCAMNVSSKMAFQCHRAPSDMTTGWRYMLQLALWELVKADKSDAGSTQHRRTPRKRSSIEEFGSHLRPHGLGISLAINMRFHGRATCGVNDGSSLTHTAIVLRYCVG
jgi:hypothetical protein